MATLAKIITGSQGIVFMKFSINLPNVSPGMIKCSILDFYHFLSHFSKKSSMKREIPILFGIVGVLLISGCVSETGEIVSEKNSNGNKIEIKQTCKPDYINTGAEYGNNLLSMGEKDACKKTCYDNYEVTSYRITDSNDSGIIGGVLPSVFSTSCECDINNCGDAIISYCGDGDCKENESCKNCPDDCGKCPEECGNNFCRDNENILNCPLDCCSEAKILIQGATYDDEILNLYLINSGKFDLNLDFILWYSDGSIDKFKDNHIIKSGELETFVLEDINTNLVDVFAVSKNCKFVADSISKNWISSL